MFVVVRYTIAIFVTSALILSLAANVAAQSPPRSTRSTIDLNSASAAELVKLPGIGVSRARDIIDHRGRRRFRRPSDLMRVRGIGRKIYMRIKPFIHVGPPAAKGSSG